MKIYKESDESEVEIIKPWNEDSEDKGLIKLPTNPSEHKRIPDDVREIIAVDTINLGSREAGRIHGVGKTTANDIANDSGIRAANRFDIQNLATAKLMQTLNLLDPGNIEKEKDKVSVMNGLANVLDKLDEGDKGKNGGRSVHLHMYAPNQKPESAYDTIEVGGKVE
jgi:hypothetical protein